MTSRCVLDGPHDHLMPEGTCIPIDDEPGPGEEPDTCPSDCVLEPGHDGECR